MDDVAAARLAALRIEYAAARAEFYAAWAAVEAPHARIKAAADRAQILYLTIYELEHEIAQEDLSWPTPSNRS